MRVVRWARDSTRQCFRAVGQVVKLGSVSSPCTIVATPMNTVVSTQIIDNVLVAQITVPQMRDIELVQRVKEELIAAIQAGTPRAIILDLSQLEFIGSVGFLAFLAARRASNESPVVLCNLDARVHEVFVLCRLVPQADKSDTPFLVQPTVEAALAALSAAPHK